MSARLAGLLGSYLSLRRSLGYDLGKTERHVGQFIAWLDQARPGQEGFTCADAVEWACQPGGQPLWHAARLGAVRMWAAYAHAHDPAVPAVPARLLPAGRRRPAPYVYSGQDVEAVMGALAARARDARMWTTRWRNTTAGALTGLLACTGARVGEAIGLDRADVDLDEARIRIASKKTGRERLALLHPTAVARLATHAADPARPAFAGPGPEPFLVSSVGKRVIYNDFHFAFHRAVLDAGLEPKGRARPTVHALRHTYAVNQIAAAYRDGADPARRLTLLATWLGHVSPSSTYWYLTATPELLAAAGRLLEDSAGAAS
ncbi:MAG: tyrosine-type recombinase/integrase [Bifidobacteriaceae bacterium]|jgi:integrase|nr:tyrosine-type recombinase/integrase [Bifidobacteriaceae bacterium]